MAKTTKTLTKLSIYVDNGPALRGTYSEHRDMIDVSTHLPRWDPNWSTFDSSGHFHACDAASSTFPTLSPQIEHVECDGSCGGGCEGYDRTIYSCSICGEDVEPGTIPGPHTESIPGMCTWEVMIEASLPGNQQFTVRIDDGNQITFGVAITADRQVTVLGDDVTVKTQLVGIGAPGRTETGQARNTNG